MSKWDRVQDSFERAHSDLFSQSRYTATFFNYAQGTYDPDTGEMSGQTRSQFAQVQIELVPPGMDTTVDVDGTSFSWDTSMRVPETSSIVGNLKTLGEDTERPTEVEVSDPEESDPTVYQLHGYSYEKGSGMIMCRLIEQ